ncbi:MAG: MGMT family protein [Candidatus Dormibacteraceae bacterium]
MGRSESFAQSAAAIVASLRPGEVVSYGEIAIRAGRPGAARAVGNVLAASEGLPWWRVVRRDGSLARSKDGRQAALLGREGVGVIGGRIADRELRARLAPDLLGAPPR